jgi:hypothetical protein
MLFEATLYARRFIKSIKEVVKRLSDTFKNYYLIIDK